MITIGLVYCSSHAVLSTVSLTDPTIQACYNTTKEIELHPGVIVSFGLPHDLFVLVSIIMDAGTYYITKSKTTASEVESIRLNVFTTNSSSNPPIPRVSHHKEILDIPLKATIFSTMSAMPAMVIGIISAILRATPYQKQCIVLATVLVVALLKMPLIITVTFRRNKLNQALSQANAREQNRQIEIQHAREERNRRRQAWEA